MRGPSYSQSDPKEMKESTVFMNLLKEKTFPELYQMGKTFFLEIREAFFCITSSLNAQYNLGISRTTEILGRKMVMTAVRRCRWLARGLLP